MNVRVLTALTVLSLVGCGMTAYAQVPATDKDFCERVQRDLTGTTLKLNNIVYPDFDSFKESKTKIFCPEL